MDPFILSGSKVQEGVARIVVIAVGVHSFHGKTMMAMRDGGDSDLTPLQIKLDSLAESIAKLGMAAALIMLFTLSLKYWIIALVNNQIPDFADGFAAMVKIVIQAITIVVVAVPEGLPMAVTLALAFATTQMIKDNNLVRILAACETMGNATVICTDKTGTLTQNLMTVVQGIIAGTSMDGTPNPKDFKRKLADPVLKLLIEGISVNSSAFEGKDENGKVGFVGSKTEVALLNFGVNMGEDVKSPRDNRKVGLVYPFASKNKSMTTVIETPDSDTPYRQYTKGASEIVLESCTHYLDGDGKVQQMDQASRDNYLRTISRFAHQALRTICLAYRDISKADFDAFNPEQAPLEHLVAIGIVGIEDPLREGVVESVAECRRAGVYVKMITGDNVETAKAIAKKAGIWSPGGVVISGPEFRRLSPEEQAAIVPRLQVLARSSPTDKQIVVRTLQNQHEVVAMTGDGTNDGPALKMSDVGFSMGIAGTEVAKEASAIILMDDNFNSIVKALRWGRAVNSGVRKFLQFQLTVNITAVVVAFVSAVISETNESVLTAVQLLWVNLIMDTLAALALATEPPTSDILDNPPVPRNASLITYKMWKHILGQAFFQITINLIFMYLGEKLIPNREHEVVKTVVFNSFVFLQIFNELNCRRINDELNIFHDIFNNWIFIAVQVIVILGQIILVNYGGTAFSTVPLNAAEWVISIVIGALSLPVGFILRLLPDFGDDSAQIHKPVVSRERMMLESAIQDVSSKLKVYAALRHKPRRSTGGSRMKSVSSVHE
jgi:Ca2+-transporting ATPase